MIALLILGTALICLLLLEAAYVMRGQKTISRRCQDWVNANPQLSCSVCFAAGCIIGWLLAHWTQPPT
jgi:uncharacterized membrane protein YbjE (DUF340 family)